MAKLNLNQRHKSKLCDTFPLYYFAREIITWKHMSAFLQEKIMVSFECGYC